jgi:hypothetical protein
MKYIKLFEEATDTAAENPEVHIKTKISDELAPLKVAAKSAAKVLDGESIINKFEQFLLSKITEQLNIAKTGKGGDKFAYACYLELVKLVDEGLASISGLKKAALNLMAPPRKEFKSMSNNIDKTDQYSIYFDKFSELVDFAFLVGWMPQLKPYESQLADYSKQVSDWIIKNQKSIINSISGKIENFIYGPAK